MNATVDNFQGGDGSHETVPKSFQIHTGVASKRPLLCLDSCKARNLIDVNCELSTWSSQKYVTSHGRARGHEGQSQ